MLSDVCKEYADIIVKICNENGIVCLNLFDDFGFCWQKHTSDGCHPNEAGHILLAKAIAKKLETIKLSY